MHMRSLESVLPGMRLARPITRADGTLLLGRGVVLRAEHIEALRRLAIGFLYISDGYFDDVDLPQMVRTEVRAQAQKAVQQSLTRVHTKKGIETHEVSRVVNAVLDEVLGNRNATLALVDARGVATELIEHSVGVTILSLHIGMQFGLTRPQLVELGMGALLHDVGKVVVPAEILYKPGQLSPAEREIIAAHADHGFQILRQIRELSLLSAHVAYQHHERQDGSGYPRRLKGKEIHLYGSICAVADVYDAMTSARPYRAPIYPAVALHWVRSQAGTQLHEQAARALARVVAPYPLATMVELTTGEIGLVRELSSAALERPVVLLFKDAQGRPYAEPTVLDLSQAPEVAIKGAVSGMGLLTS